MPHMKFLFAIAAFILSTSCFAQRDSTRMQAADSNSVTIHKDFRIDLLVKKTGLY